MNVIKAYYKHDDNWLNVPLSKNNKLAKLFDKIMKGKTNKRRRQNYR